MAMRATPMPRGRPPRPRRTRQRRSRSRRRRKNSVVTAEDVREAAAGLAGVAVRTPLRFVESLNAYLKLESLQPIGAFKLRGAYNAIRRLPDPARKRGVITYSSGNHGQALAYAAQLVGVRAVVVMPETAPAVKLAGVKKWGGEVVLAGRTSDDRQRAAEDIAARDGLAIVPPFDHPDIVAGQATVALEIAEQLADVRTVVVPVGGGGLIAGVVTGLAAAGSRSRSSRRTATGWRAWRSWTTARCVRRYIFSGSTAIWRWNRRAPRPRPRCAPAPSIPSPPRCS